MPLYPVSTSTSGSPTDLDQLIDALTGRNDIGAIAAYAQISTPGALTAAINTTSGSLTGTYQYKVALVTGYWQGPAGTGTINTQGNTGGGAASNTVSPSAQQVNLSSIPIGGIGVVARIIYRTKANGSTFYFLQQINDNVSTSWTDNIADSALVTVMPSANTTGSYYSGDGKGLVQFDPTTGHKHTGAAGDAPKIDSTGLANGAATDTVFGNRIVDDTATPNTGPNPPTMLFSFFGKMIRQITGELSWVTAPVATIKNLLLMIGIIANLKTSYKTDLVGAINEVQVMPVSSAIRQAIINGGFKVNQREVSGTVTLVAGQYGHDRWKAGAGGCTYTFSTTNNITTITITAGSLLQVIEGINLSDGTYTLSWTGTSQGKIGAGSFAASGVTGTVVGGTNLSIEFNVGTLSKVQFNIGNIALPFQPRSYGEELKLCERYCYLLTAASASGFFTKFASGQVTSATQATFTIQIPEMRIPPIVTTSAVSLFLLSDASFSASKAVSAIATGVKTNKLVELNITCATGLVAGNITTLTASNNTTAYILFDAEL